MTLKKSAAGSKKARAATKAVSKRARPASAASRREDICYKRNFLERVVIRVDLASAPGFLSREMPSTLRKKIQEAFPIIEPREVQTRRVKMSMDAKDHFEAAIVEKYPEWLFHSLDRKQSFGVSREAVWIQERAYTSFAALQQTFLALTREIPGQEEVGISRLGLRYINVIESREGNPIRWDGLFDQRLLDAAKFEPTAAGSRLSQALLELSWVVDGSQLRMKAGMPNPDRPAPISRRHFVLEPGFWP